MATIGGYNVVTDGLVLSLDAANRRSYVSGSSTWFDLSGNRNSGSLINSPTFDSANGGSVVFDGISEYMTLPTITFTNTPYTIEMFGNITGLLEPGANRRSIFGHGLASEFSNPTIYFTNINVDSVNTYFNFGFSTAGSIITGSNFHWVFTLDQSKNVFMYFNTKRTANPDTQLTVYSNIVTTINRFGTWSGVRYYQGNLYYARFYNKALSAEEVLQNYNATKGRFGL